MTKKKKHGPRYKVKGKPGAYVKRDRLGRFKEWTNWRRGTLIDAAFKAEPASTPGYGHRKDYPRKKKASRKKPVGFFTKGKGKGRKVIPITPSAGKIKRKVVRVKRRKERKPEKTEKKPGEKKEPGKKEKPPKKKKKRAVKIPRKPRPRPREMTYIERMHLQAACKKFNIDPQEIDDSISYYENKKHLQELAEMKGYSKAEITSEKQERKEWTEQYEEYLSTLRSELEDAGYEVTAPTM